MNIKILQYVEGAKQATGLAVVIDVFRAFSIACYVFQNGAKKILPVGDIDQAFLLKKQHPDYLLMGERNEKKPEGFDFGNSPTFIENTDFSGKTVIHTTSAGTQGLVNAINASEVITGSFVNAGAIVRYIQQYNPDDVSLVCMGYSAVSPADEDLFLAQYVKNELTGQSTDFTGMVKKLREGSGKRLLDPANAEHSPAKDFDLCLALNRFNFVLKAERKASPMYLHKIMI